MKATTTKSESENFLSKYMFTRKFVLWCTVKKTKQQTNSLTELPPPPTKKKKKKKKKSFDCERSHWMIS